MRLHPHEYTFVLKCITDAAAFSRAVHNTRDFRSTWNGELLNAACSTLVWKIWGCDSVESWDISWHNQKSLSPFIQNSLSFHSKKINWGIGGRTVLNRLCQKRFLYQKEAADRRTEGLKSVAADELLRTVRSPSVCFCVYCSGGAAGDQASHSARRYTLQPWFSERGSQGSLGGSEEAADLLPEHSAGSRRLQRAALGRCWETVKKKKKEKKKLCVCAWALHSQLKYSQTS